MASRDHISNNYKESGLLKADTPCLLCNSCFHPTYRCSLTKSIKNKEIQVPLEFCQIHCGRLSESCKNGDCSTFKTKKGKSIDLTCQHKDIHFLLCDKYPCHKISDKYYKINNMKKKTET